MTVRYTSEGRRALTEAELEMLRKAEAMPPNYDEDCPELTPEMEEAFREARRRNPFPGNWKPKGTAYGILSQYAKPELMEREGEAFELAMKEKYRDEAIFAEAKRAKLANADQ